MKPTLTVDLHGVVLQSPVVAAAGCLRSLRDVHGLLDVRKLGAIVTETLTAAPMQGRLGPRAVETPGGLITDTGYQNPGVEGFVERELPLLVRSGVPVIASIAGESVETVIRAANGLAGSTGVVALELDLSFPSTEHGGGIPAARGDHAAELIGAVVRMSRLPVFAKLCADVSDIVDVARACHAAGAHGFTLIQGVRGMGMVAQGDSVVPLRGRLSGPSIRPMAIRAIGDVADALPDTPIFGCGGVSDGPTAIELMRAGAWAVQVGTAMLIDPEAPVDIAKAILRHLKTVGVLDASALRPGGASSDALDDDRSEVDT